MKIARSVNRQRSLISLIVLTLFPLLMMGGGLFYCCRNPGFSVDKITSRLSYNHGWEVEPLSEKQREFINQKVLSQNYYYLSSGNHCYAFISEDREYILKFFKMQHLFPKDGWGHFPLSLLQHMGFKLEKSNQLFSERIFANYKEAYETLQEETGILYLHLNKNNEFNSSVTLIDTLGKKYHLNLNTLEFVIQQRAEKIYDHLEELIKRGKYEELRFCIRAFLKLIASRCENGFVDQDLSIRNNFGFVGRNAIQFDCASLTRDDSMKYPLNFRNEILRIAERLDDWAQEHHPDASILIQEEAQRIINQSF